MTVEIRDLRIEYPDRLLFDHVNLTVDDGELVAVETRVLDGATSLLKGIGGFLTGVAGSVEIDGVELLTDSDLRTRFTIGFVYESEGLLSFYNNFQNISLPLKYHTDMNMQSIMDAVTEVCDLLGIDEALLPLHPHALNDVQTRLVNLARALIARPRLLLIDELEGGMSDELVRDTMTTLRHRQKQDPMAIIVTTASDLVMEHADRTFAIADCGLKERANQ